MLPGMRQRHLCQMLIALASLVAGGGAAGAESNEIASVRTDWHGRATNQLDLVVLFKPVESANQTLVARLAPLILQEITSTNGAAPKADFPAPLPASDASNRFTIYARERKVQLQGQSHDEITYVWFYPSSPNTNRTEAEALPLQGVRITLDSSGHPVIWEPLAATGPVRPVFVAGSLEHLALMRYQSRLPERRFVIEPDISRQPGVIVPRTLDDSPVVFGPILYLRASSRACWTVICRCMPAQAKTVATAYYYQLAPWPKDLNRALRPYAPPVRRQILQRVELFERRDARRQLRLPEKF
jgi:hypothetical protein